MRKSLEKNKIPKKYFEILLTTNTCVGYAKIHKTFFFFFIRFNSTLNASQDEQVFGKVNLCTFYIRRMFVTKLTYRVYVVNKNCL